MKKKQPPPVPPAGRSTKGSDHGRSKAAHADKVAQQQEGKQPSPDVQANIEQNTTNQGYQQDR